MLLVFVVVAYSYTYRCTLPLLMLHDFYVDYLKAQCPSVQLIVWNWREKEKCIGICALAMQVHVPKFVPRDDVKIETEEKKDQQQGGFGC